MGVIQSMSELTVTEEVGELARVLIENVPFSSKAQIDAFHLAIAAIHGIEHLPGTAHIIHNAAMQRIVPVLKPVIKLGVIPGDLIHR